jgi:hypothetical protein
VRERQEERLIKFSTVFTPITLMCAPLCLRLCEVCALNFRRRARIGFCFGSRARHISFFVAITGLCGFIKPACTHYQYSMEKMVFTTHSAACWQNMVLVSIKLASSDPL